jgi:asparagine synthase (glutamine-hydrolysing)
MSGICGMVSLEGGPVDNGHVAAMDAAQELLGTKRILWSESGVSLAQRQSLDTPQDRLEGQPGVSSNGRWILVFDGRVDNRTDLLAQLPSPKPLDQIPDSALVMAAHERWGIAAPGNIVGDFAYAFWDRRARQLLLVRSPFGRRPLFFHRRGGLLSFASHPAALYRLPWIRRGLSLRFIIEDRRDLSLYRDIRQVRPAETLLFEVHKGRVSQSVFWKIDDETKFEGGSTAEHVEQFRCLFHSVIKQSLRTSSKVGIYLSGGLDSSAVAVTAAEILAPTGERLSAFTEVPRRNVPAPTPSNRYADETPLVRALGDRYPAIDLNFVDGNAANIWTGLEQWFEAGMMAPYVPLNRVYSHRIDRLARELGVGTLLTGSSGNYTFSWDGRMSLDVLVAQGRWRRAWRVARSSAGPARALAKLGLRTPGPLLRGLFSSRGRRIFVPLHPDMQRWIFKNQAAPSLSDQRWGPMASRLGGIEFAGERMMYGVETRDPCGDQRIVDFCSKLPDDQFFGPEGTRLLARRVMAGRVPDQIRLNRKRGLQAADGLFWLRTELKRLREDCARIVANPFMQRFFDLSLLPKLTEGLEQSVFRDRMDPLFCDGLLVWSYGMFVLWFEERYGGEHDFDAGSPGR